MLPLEPSDRTLFLVDSMSLVFQSFYAIRNLTNPQGMPTNAIFGFTKTLQKLIADYRPSHIVATFDSPGPTFRHAFYPAYKATRDAAPEDFTVQIPHVFRILDAMGIPNLARPGFEADDLIGTLARRAAAHGMEVLIVSADKDLFQLVTDRVRMLRHRKDDMTIFGPAEVQEKMGVRPDQIVDYLALMGDSSDNIPGVPKVGPKTARLLLEEFGTLDALYAGLDRVASASRRKLLEEGREKAYLSQRLARIDCDVEVAEDVEEMVCHPRLDAPELLALYREFGFGSLGRSAAPPAAQPASPTPAGGGTQLDLFGDAMAASAVAGPPATAPSPAAAGAAGETRVRIVSTEADLQEAVAAVAARGRIAFDTETTSVDSMLADLVGISFACVPGEAWYVPVGHRLDGDQGRQLPLETVQRLLSPVLADPEIRRIAQNAKYDIRILRRHGFEVAPVQFDTMLASYLLDPDASHGLKRMSLARLGIEMQEIDSLIGRGRNASTMDLVEIDSAAPYAGADADMTLRLHDQLVPELAEAGLLSLFDEMEMPLVEVLEAMEREGVTVDAEALHALSAELRKRLDALTLSIYASAGHPFNIKSPQQVAAVLFDELKLKKRKKSGADSTAGGVLEELAKEHPLPGLILEHRLSAKLLSTYAEALPRLVNPRTGRLHTSYNQTIAATGRLSSSNPNLQNIPAREEEGRQIRQAFVPNGSGEVFVAADYSQIELRVLAHLTGDEGLRRAFRDDLDIHAQTAARLFGVAAEAVTGTMRSQAKTVNFGILYGMSAHRLSNDLKITHAQAQEFIDEYFAAYPAVRRWEQELLETARRTGCVTTLAGRRRWVPKLNSANRNERSNAERVAVNTPVQGSAADMIKLAMIRLQADIRERGLAARMVMQVHDELVFSVPEGEVAALLPLVRGRMEGALPLSVPVRVDIVQGRNWAEC